MPVKARGDNGTVWYADLWEWVAIRGFAMEANDQEALNLDLDAFSANGQILHSSLCGTLATAMTTHKDFTGTLGRVQRLGTGEIECPSDPEARTIRGREIHADEWMPDGHTPYVVAQDRLEEFLVFLTSCDGFTARS